MLDEWIRGSRDANSTGEPFIQGKKKKYILVILICFGLLALIWPVGKVSHNTARTAGTVPELTAANSAKSQLTAELEAILSQIEGAGKVQVSLTLTSEGAKTYASNRRDEKREIEETQLKGIKKTSKEENQVEDLAVSAGSPVLLEEKFPEVLGVLVVADGGGRMEVQERLTHATATLLNISAHRVRVMPRKGAGHEE